MKLFILGHGRHGKDTFAEFLTACVPGIKFVSSSLFVGERAVFPTLGPRYGYATPEECFEDRANHRQEWHELISAFNTPDKASLARALFEEFDLYVGLRCRVELEASRHLADLVIWVDRSAVLPPESETSNTITADDCDVIVPNNGSIEELFDRAEKLASILYPKTT